MKRSFTVLAALVLAVSSANAVTTTWNVDAAGDWGTAGNWTPGIPATGDNVVLGNAVTTARALTVSANYSLGKITVSNTNAGSLYTIGSNTSTNRNITLTGAGTIISVGALGANLTNTTYANYLTFVLPALNVSFDIGGATLIGPVSGGNAANTLTKTGAGALTWNGNGSLASNLTVSAGNFIDTGSSSGLGNFLMTPTGSGDMTYSGTGILGMASGKTARFVGTASGTVIVAPGTAAVPFAGLRIGVPGGVSTVTLENNTRYNADVSGVWNGQSDTFAAIGTLNLGVTGTTNSLYITLPSGSLQSSAYVLAGASNSITGKFNQVYYNGSLVANPETAGSIGTGYQLVYGSKYIMLVNPATNRRINWVNPDTSTATTNYWDTPANWTRGTAPNSSDNVFVGFGTVFLAGSNNSRTVGSFRTEGSGATSLGNNFTLTCRADNGASGDFYWGSSGLMSGAGYTLNIYGNLLIPATQALQGAGVGTINFYGANKAIQVRPNDVWTGNNNIASQNVQNIYGSYWENSTAANGGSFDGQRFYCNRNTVDVKPGGQILARPDGNASQWAARRFIFEGGQSNLPALGSAVTFVYQPAFEDNGPAGSNRLVIAGGVAYPQDVKVGADYWGSKALKDATYTWRIKGGDFTVGRDFLIAETAGNSPSDGLFVNFEENGTLAKVNVTVKRDMFVNLAGVGGNADVVDAGSATRGVTAPTFSERYGIRGKNATIRIGRDLTVGTVAQAYYAWWPRTGALVDLGNATIYIGRNLVINRMDSVARAFYSAGTSTLICDGNGTGQTQLIRTWGITDGIALNNLRIRNVGGVVQLDNNIAYNPAGLNPYASYPRGNGYVAQGGDLLLTGNLSVECGTFQTGTTGTKGRQIAFSAGSHTIYVDPSATLIGTVGITQASGVFDNMILQQNAVLTLLSNIAIASTDNFIMWSGSKLYLNGFSLTAYGQSYLSNSISPLGVPFTVDGSNGTIFGTAAVPEPATLFCVGSVLVGGLGWMRRRRML